MEKTCVFYCRGQDTNSHNSIQAQTATCCRYAMENGYTLLKIFCDERTSSTSKTNRCGLHNLLYFIGTTNVDAVIVTDMDRISRDTEDFHVIYNLILCQAELIFVNNELDTNTPEDQLVENIIGIMKQYHAHIHSQKIKEGMKRAKAKSVRSK
jgi:DNA invertase Pin-like site-specific DNA recombinase